eukprot:COSAG02_NODE_3019_length_7535_cov_9.178456_5_plen_77_part_00
MVAELAVGQVRVSALQDWGLLGPAAIAASQVSLELHATCTVLIRRHAMGAVNATTTVSVSALAETSRLSTTGFSLC